MIHSALMKSFLVFLSMLFLTKLNAQTHSWIRINLLGYKPGSIKEAVWCSREQKIVARFQIIDANTRKIVMDLPAGKPFGAYGPFTQTCRLDFSLFKKTGTYFLEAGDAISPVFQINPEVYKGKADFCLKYMRQQRSGFNPFLKDSCHTHDGYTMYGPMPDSTHIDVSGGWHDATDYLQYSMTSANATYHLLAAYRDFSSVFEDHYAANGLEGKNGIPDVLDEGKWGLDWLLKMHPRPDWMFNQLADDRDHRGFRLPNKDSADYGKGFERPVYFVTGEPQGLGKYRNRTSGTSSTAGKFSSAFSLGYHLFKPRDPGFASLLKERAKSAYAFGLRKLGNCQTACNREPYFYEEDNWVDDMELAAAGMFQLTGDKKMLNDALSWARQEKYTPWLGADTAKHYQWYPFINLGHYELAKLIGGEEEKELIAYYREGIEKVWRKANQNAFYRGIPFIWCSNNLQTSFAIQCYWYRQLSGDQKFASLEQASFDWLFGCNPWGTSMVVGLPVNRDYPDDPHSSLNHLMGYQTLGGLVDGPVYGSIFKRQLGIRIVNGDEYAEFQSDAFVYHDDFGDYVTNEPTMDGTASLIYLLAAEEAATLKYEEGAIIRGNPDKKQLALVFTGDGFGDGADFIAATLKNKGIRASFFLTGNFYRNSQFKNSILELKAEGNYMGPHSDKHLLYCDWDKRDSLLVTQEVFQKDLANNYAEMKKLGIEMSNARFFLPPYEWYNDSISQWTRQMGFQLVNYTPGTISHTDYTTPDMKNYQSSAAIYQSIKQYESNTPGGLNGFILLVHIGTEESRTDKFYKLLPQLIDELKSNGYQFLKIDEFLRQKE